MKNIMIAALVVLAGLACKKEKENAPPPPPLTPEELLTKGPWTKYSILYKDKYMTDSIEQYTSYPLCYADDKHVFTSDKTFTWYQGTVKCPGDTKDIVESHTWQYVPGDSINRIRFYYADGRIFVYRILQLTDSSFIMQLNGSVNSETTKFRR